MNKQEDQPKSLFEITPPLVEYCGLQRVEKIIIGICTALRNWSGTDHFNKSDPMNALKQLLAESLSRLGTADTWKPTTRSAEIE
jgi:hypothetical protein